MKQAQAEDWEAAVEAWQWNGLDVTDIMIRLPLIRDYFPHKLTEWEHTVPVESRGKVYVESGHPCNSEETLHRSAQLLAVDTIGNALVLKLSHNTYTDEEVIECLVTPTDDAMSLLQNYRDGQVDDDYHSLSPGM